ncbi:DUF1127 domain-containing protein [Elioraea sp.]|uniref:DUF1127 domain-containing protein n=1 Tax=Elioraea sp. TaxID=2185103 RepID=UPI0025C41121|nr:DUF1127 domain-containing protein [Elioraea sp.]
MSAPTIATRTTQAGFAGGAQPAPVSLWTVMRRMWVAVTTRHELASLDERMLHDLGLSKADVFREVGRAPWDTAPVRRGDRML